MKRDASEKPVSFETLLDGGHEKHLVSITDQIHELTGGAQNRFIEATIEEETHSRQVSPTTGVCTHCHHHGNTDAYLTNSAANAAKVSTITKQVEQQRQ